VTTFYSIPDEVRIVQMIPVAEPMGYIDEISDDPWDPQGIAVGQMIGWGLDGGGRISPLVRRPGSTEVEVAESVTVMPLADAHTELGSRFGRRAVCSEVRRFLLAHIDDDDGNGRSAAELVDWVITGHGERPVGGVPLRMAEAIVTRMVESGDLIRDECGVLSRPSVAA
jgi:hypothetical protein